jgi:hypothetical protein
MTDATERELRLMCAYAQALSAWAYGLAGDSTVPEGIRTDLCYAGHRTKQIAEFLACLHEIGDDLLLDPFENAT